MSKKKDYRKIYSQSQISRLEKVAEKTVGEKDKIEYIDFMVALYSEKIEGITTKVFLNLAKECFSDQLYTSIRDYCGRNRVKEEYEFHKGCKITSVHGMEVTDEDIQYVEKQIEEYNLPYVEYVYHTLVKRRIEERLG